MIHLIDFDHYLQAARMLWEGLSPYGKVEFFAPPWMALLIGPLLLLPAKVAQIIWMLANILAVNISALVSLQWLKPIPLERWKRIILILLVGFLPSALFSYITGQISPLVALAALLMAKEISSQRSRPLVFILGILLVSLKPHIVLLPILLLMLELIRQKKLVIVLWCGIGLLIVALFGFLIDPQWPVELVKSWASGIFGEGNQGWFPRAILACPTLEFVPGCLLVLSCIPLISGIRMV